MTDRDPFTAYTAALESVVDLPRVHAARVEALEQRARSDLAQLERRRKEDAQHWIELRDRSSRLSRRVDELALQVGAPSGDAVVAEPYPAQAIPGALESLRSDLDKAEQSWQWVIRHRERLRRHAPTPPPSPVYVAPTAPVTPVAAPEPTKSGLNPMVLISIATVAVVLLVVIVAMAL